MNLYDGAGNFVNTIKSTKEFSELIHSKNIIETNSSLKNEVNEYIRKLNNIYSSSKSANDIKAKGSELNSQYANLFRTPEVDRFIKATNAFNEMMFKLYKYINDSMETELKLK